MPKKRILLTGAAGFLGINLIHKLMPLKSKYLVFTVGSSTEGLDLRRLSDVQIAYKMCSPDVVIHLAARCGGIGANQKSPATFWRDNLIMSANMMDFAADYGATRFITLGTVCSYPKVAPLPFTEDKLFTGWPEPTNAAYGVAKLAILEGLRAYHRQYGLEFTYLIPTNMYGPFDHFDPERSHVIPAMLLKLSKAKDQGQKVVEFWGDGSATRDFLYAPDCCDAIVSAIERSTDGEPINLGSGQEISMKALAALCADVVGYDGEICWQREMPNGQPRRAVDASRAARVLDWKPSTSLMEGLRTTYVWYRNAIRPKPQI